MLREMKGTCIVCGFQVRGDTLEELDESFRLHFENNGHDSYFFIDKENRMIERDISKL